MKVKIDIGVDMPKPSLRPEYKQASICDKACDYMDMCEAGEADDYHFKYLKSLYSKLNKKKQLPRHLSELMVKLTDFMVKHAGQDSGEDQLDLEGVDIFKFEDK